MLGHWELISAGCYVVCDGQLDNNFETRRPKVLGTYRTAVQSNRFRGNGKPQTIPSRCFPVPVYSIERLKYRLERTFRNTRTVVPDRKQCPRFGSAPIDLQNDLDIASRPCEADCVANYVFTSASKGMSISIPENDRTGCLKTDGFAQGLCFEVAVRRHFLDELNQIHVFSLRRRKPGFQARERQKLAH